MFENNKFNPNYPNGKRTFLHASKFALSGLMYAFRTQAAIRLEILLLVLSIPVAIEICQSLSEFILLVMPFFMLLVVELLNTAIEATIDRISLERHPLSKIAKDTAAAAVLITVALVVIIWCAKIITMIVN